MADETRDEPRKLVIRRSVETYIVDEAKFDTVIFTDTGSDAGKTYKSAGFVPIAMIVNGSEVQYEPRKRGEDVPGRQEVAVAQVGALTDAGQNVPAVVMRAADLSPIAPAEAVPADTEPDTEPTSRKPRTS